MAGQGAIGDPPTKHDSIEDEEGFFDEQTQKDDDMSTQGDINTGPRSRLPHRPSDRWAPLLFPLACFIGLTQAVKYVRVLPDHECSIIVATALFLSVRLLPDFSSRNMYGRSDINLEDDFERLQFFDVNFLACFAYFLIPNILENALDGTDFCYSCGYPVMLAWCAYFGCIVTDHLERLFHRERGRAD